MTTSLDTLLIDGYTSGINAPATTDEGKLARVAVDANGRANLSYDDLAQTLSASGTWNGAASKIFVGGSGARTITLPDAVIAGFELSIVDVAGNAASGTITVDPSGSGVIDASSTKTITTNYGNRRLAWVSAGVWVQC